MLCNKVENRPEWLKCARQGGEFLRKYGHDGNYDWYFSLTRDGRPLIEPYNIFSYTFATMAFAQLAKASGDKEYAPNARSPASSKSATTPRTNGARHTPERARSRISPCR